MRWGLACTSGSALQGCPRGHLCESCVLLRARVCGSRTAGTHPWLVPADPGELQMDCRASRGQLAVPQDTTAVAHGDVNINVTDFLKSVLS